MLILAKQILLNFLVALGILFKMTFYDFSYAVDQSYVVKENHILMETEDALSVMFTARFILLTIKAPAPQNGQTHPNNSSANCRRIV